MTKLALISKPTQIDGVNEIGDVVVIREDSHIFTVAEHEVFDIVEIPDSVVIVRELYPEVTMARKVKTTEWTVEEPERKMVWKDADGNFKEIARRVKYPLRYDTSEKKFKENYSRYIENTTVVVSK